MLRIGLTGGIGSGKSAVAERFARRGVVVIDADVITRELMAPDAEAYREIVARFGREALAPDGQLDRAWLRRRVFADAAARRRLEAILHPRVRREIRDRATRATGRYVLIVIPLLVESGMQDLVDRVLVVDAEDRQRIQRIIARSGLSEAEARAIMAAQADRATRLQAADDVIVNNADLAALDREVERLHRLYLGLAAPTEEA